MDKAYMGNIPRASTPISALARDSQEKWTNVLADARQEGGIHIAGEELAVEGPAEGEISSRRQKIGWQPLAQKCMYV
jgi:hypothetical protein